MLIVKTGMSSEKQLAYRMAASDVVVLSGIMTAADLCVRVSPKASAIISVGLCGGIAPGALVGDVFICDTLITPDGEFKGDVAWRKRLWAKGQFHERPWWSSGNFNTANSVEQRAALFKKTGCWIIDDESYAVAKFAKDRGIPFQALRAVSDGTESDLPKAISNALNPDGTPNIRSLLLGLLQDPGELAPMTRVAAEYNESMAALADALRLVGPYFAFQ